MLSYVILLLCTRASLCLQPTVHFCHPVRSSFTVQPAFNKENHRISCQVQNMAKAKTKTKAGRQLRKSICLNLQSWCIFLFFFYFDTLLQMCYVGTVDTVYGTGNVAYVRGEFRSIPPTRHQRIRTAHGHCGRAGNGGRYITKGYSWGLEDTAFTQISRLRKQRFIFDWMPLYSPV